MLFDNSEYRASVDLLDIQMLETPRLLSTSVFQCIAYLIIFDIIILLKEISPSISIFSLTHVLNQVVMIL